MKFSTSAVAVTALLASSASARPTRNAKRDVLNAFDFKVVNLALNLENLELNLWDQGLRNFTAQNFTDAGLPAGFGPGLELLRDQETAHVALLEEVLSVPFTNCTYKFPVTTPQELVMLGQIITSVGEGAYLGALANITSPSVRKSAGQIIGNEARQNSYLRNVEGLNFFNAPNFDTALSANQAYSLATQYWNCPVATNPAFNLTQIPLLTLSFANPNATMDHQPGEVIQVMWNATEAYLGMDVHLIFLSDVNQVVAPLNQTMDVRNGTAMGTTRLPPLVNGTTFVVATTFNGTGPIPDNLNFAIGPLVVA